MATMMMEKLRMLCSIVVKVMKGGTCIGAWPGFWGYPCPPSLRTYSWNGHLGHTVQLQAIWLWLDVVPGPLLVGCNFLGRHKKVTKVMNIKLTVSSGSIAMGMATVRLGQTLQVASY